MFSIFLAGAVSSGIVILLVGVGSIVTEMLALIGVVTRDYTLTGALLQAVSANVPSWEITTAALAGGAVLVTLAILTLRFAWQNRPNLR